jgi:hypothetical protein
METRPAPGEITKGLQTTSDKIRALAKALRCDFRDVNIVDDEGSGETILEIEVRGKRGFGYCKSMPDAVGACEGERVRLIGRQSPRFGFTTQL